MQDPIWPPVPDGVAVVVFAVYDRPLDFPDHWVVRRWFTMSDGRVVADVVPRLANVLDEARRLVPETHRTRVVDESDPFLFETWV